MPAFLSQPIGHWPKLELIQTQMTQKPMLRAEVYTRTNFGLRLVYWVGLGLVLIFVSIGLHVA